MPGVGSPGEDRLRHATPPVGDLVVRLGIDHALVGRAQVAADDGVRHGIHVAVLIAGSLERGADGMDEAGVPLRMKAEPAVVAVRSEHRVTLHVLGDQDLPWLAGTEIGGHRGEKSVPCGDVFARMMHVTPPRADVVRGIEAQPVDPEVFQPHHR